MCQIMKQFVLFSILWSAVHSLPLNERQSNESFSQNTTSAINLIERLLSRVDNRVRPGIYGPPLKVLCDFYIESFGSVDEVHMDYEVNVFFRQRWYDERLRFTDHEEPVILPHHYISRFWLPDIFFPNEKTATFHNAVVPNQVIKIFPDGLVRYSVRMTLKLSCPMYMFSYPLDRQTCRLSVSSYSYTEDDVILEWLQPYPLEIHGDRITLPQFSLVRNSTGRCVEKYSTGSFSCLQATFELSREVGYYVLQTYIPSILIVSLSWVSFWINKDAVPARITLGVTTVLTMTTQLSSSRSSSVKVSYPKSMDVWYSACMVLVYGALIEYAFVNVLTRKSSKVKNKHSNCCGLKRNIGNDLKGTEEGINFNCQNSNNNCNQKTDCMKRPIMTSEGLDKLSRVLFPLSFIIFNFIYWIVYS